MSEPKASEPLAQSVAPEAVMPSGAMSEPDIQVEQEEMPSASMGPEEVDA